MEDGKRWYQSKVLWTNVSLIVGAVGAYFQGLSDLNETLLVIIPAVVNTALRLVTAQPVTK